MTAFHRQVITSWGRVLRAEHRVARPAFSDQLPSLLREAEGSILPIGLGRSYGESGLNAGGSVIDLTALDRLIAFGEATGVIRAEAGTSLGAILDFAVPRGWFLPVTPGTRFVTLGGAVANDVHGKNHHGAGTFGRHVLGLGLLRSDGTRHHLTPSDPLFAATIGGLGLTGIVTDVTLALKRITSAQLVSETIPFRGLDDFFALAAESASHEYTVAWFDCLSRSVRGYFNRANHAAEGGLAVDRPARKSIPFDAPAIVLSRPAVAGFNLLHRATAGWPRRERVPYGGFFYPLDSIGQWNRMYGRRGFYQYQSVVPPAAARDATAAMLAEIARSGQGSFLAVLKTLGPLPSPGLLSFPMEGTTLALDFPNRGEDTLALLARLDAIVSSAGGRLYPAKDGRMPRAMLESGYPGLDAFRAHIDPAFSSTFWRRVDSAG